jgi:hypothetical protein
MYLIIFDVQKSFDHFLQAAVIHQAAITGGLQCQAAQPVLDVLPQATGLASVCQQSWAKVDAHGKPLGTASGVSYGRKLVQNKQRS